MKAKSHARLTVGRARFAKISAVEGIHLTKEMKDRFAEFDRRQLSPEARRKAIIKRYEREPAE